MQGNMQTGPLNLIAILEHAAKFHKFQEIVSNLSEGKTHRYTFPQALERVKKLANAITDADINTGDRIATLAWNDFRHFEAWYAITGQGAICHTVNPRLHTDQVKYIINNGGARMVLVDTDFVHLLESIQDDLSHVKQYVVMCDKADMPATELKNAIDYETFIADKPNSYHWPILAEDTASSLCYTSGTTGDPKGVLYSHRSNMLMSMVTGAADVFNLSSLSSVLMVVPMFHANSWGLVYAAPMFGAKLVLPGRNLSGEAIHHLIESEQVNFSAAVPTIWNMLLDFLDKSDKKLETLKEVVIGGSAIPESMLVNLKERYDVNVLHAWGMTEMSPVGSVNRPTIQTLKLPAEQQIKIALKQGRPLFGVEACIKNDDGNILDNDGKTQGRLMVRGPWVIKHYYGREETCLDDESWFDTGDIANIDEYGFIQLTDRAKDIIKSGGEWISSVDLENAAAGHDDVDLAAVIGIPDKKWGERPLLIIQAKKDKCPNNDDILRFLEDKVIRWWLPKQIVHIDKMPLTATGKLDKKVLRSRYISADNEFKKQ